MLRPEPVPQKVACSLCGLPWDDHDFGGGEPDAAVCVQLLLTELEEARQPTVGDLPPYPTYPSVPLPNWPVTYPGSGTAAPTVAPWMYPSTVTIAPPEITGPQAVTDAITAFIENRNFEARMSTLLGDGPNDDDDDGTAGVPALVR